MRKRFRIKSLKLVENVGKNPNFVMEVEWEWLKEGYVEK